MCTPCDEGMRDVGIRIRVCGVLVWSGMVQACEITSRHQQSYDIAAGFKYGLVVTPCGRYMAVSYNSEQTLHVYRLKADGAATLLHTVGTAAGSA